MCQQAGWTGREDCPTPLITWKQHFVKKLLALNRSEIAIRILRAANELGLRTVAIYSQEDRLALHRFKADEACLIGQGTQPMTNNREGAISGFYLDANNV